MNINNIKNTKFLKKMKIKELEDLSTDIREFIIDNVSNTGGHLSSNLGIVDLTIAIHKVFDADKDKILFDVSHQCYTHKILTGRAPLFNTLRQTNGLSGFQRMSESKYDNYEAGHSSTSLGTALGMAISRDMNNENYNIIAVIGDGSIGNGLAYEAMNQIGDTKKKVIIILNDNEMSISKNVGAIHNSLDRIRANNGYNNAKKSTKRVLKNIPIIGKTINNGITNIKKSFKKLYLKDGYFFEELGIKYYGPINGHDYHELLTYLNMAKKEKEPVLIHVITEKGKGYKPAFSDKTGLWHGVGPFDKKTGKPKKEYTLPTWSEVISNHLINLTKKDKDIVAITPAMEVGSKLTKFKELFPNNFIDAGMAEEHALLLANGLALNGKIPFISVYSTFLQRGYDEIIHDIARMNSHVIIGIDRAGIVGEDGDTHQGIYDITFLLPIPNVVISCPKDSIEAGNLLYTAYLSNKPFVIRYSKERLEYKEEKYQIIPIGSWSILEKGKKYVIITYGDFINRAYQIRKKLLENNIDIGIVNARYIKPIDTKMFSNIRKQYTHIFVYEESAIINSLGAYLVNICNDNNYNGTIKTFGIEDKYVTHGNKEDIIKSLKLDYISVYKEILKGITNNGQKNN